ncbi:MAG TPA: hypothetical protein VKG78_00455 [Opitutaceae bacterium]|nr:hypothetical protein [Opitutaceae bacterium]
MVAIFVWNAAFFYLPGLGFTYLIQFGEKEHKNYIPELKAVNHYEMPDSPGYDSQYYAQIAVHPDLRDPKLNKAVDGLAYRARRILFPIAAWVLACGDPSRALNIFAFENIACWFLLAALLLRWFPPVSWGNCARWAAVLYSFGLIFSVARALLDGPSLLVIAAGMALLESRRPWLAAAVLGISGLGKDTNVLCGAGLEPPDPRSPRTWSPWLGRAALVLLPLAAWMFCLRLLLGRGQDMGDSRNFAPPFAALAEKLQQSVSQLIAEGHTSLARFDLLVMAGLLAQFFFFAFRRRWREPWWRVGATYALLMVFLGGAVWENYPSAAARVLLPMTLAFNILVPRKGWWPVLLVIGNLGVLASADIFKPPGRESYTVQGPSALRINPADGSSVEAIYGTRNWWRPEKSRWEFWRWSKGDATVAIRNPQPFTLIASVRFRLRSVDEREAVVVQGGKVLWSRLLPAGEAVRVALGEMDLPPGDTVILFKSDRRAAYPGSNDPRRLSFSVRSFEIDLKGRR